MNLKGLTPEVDGRTLSLPEDLLGAGYRQQGIQLSIKNELWFCKLRTCISASTSCSNAEKTHLSQIADPWYEEVRAYLWTMTRHS